MMGIISHTSIGCSKEKMKETVELYDAIMPMLGAKRYIALSNEGDGPPKAKKLPAEDPNEIAPKDICAVGYGKYFPEFWINLPFDEQPASVGNGSHFCFNCTSKAKVDQIYAKAMEMGCKDNGPPGPRPQYDDKYYAAYFLDPFGNKMEVLFYDLGWMGYCDIL